MNNIYSHCVRFLIFVGLGSIPGSLRAAERPSHSVKQSEDGSIQLDAANVNIRGPSAKLEGDGVKTIMWWTNADTFLQWMANVQKPGHYRVELTYSILGNNKGSPLTITVGNQMLQAVPKVRSGVDDYRTGSAGEVTIDKPGDLEVVITPLAKFREFVISIRSVALVPVETPDDAIDISGSSIKQSPDGSIQLTAADADIDGMNAQLEGNGETNIGWWKDVGTSLLWTINVVKPGNYRIELNYALAKRYQGSKVAISVGDQTVKAKPKPTGEDTDYAMGRAGEVAIDKPGDLTVVVKPISKPWGIVMHLRSITLVPADTVTNAIDISDKPIPQEPDGSIKLTPTNAEIDGTAVRIEGGEKKHLVWWNSSNRFIKWPIKVGKTGKYNVQIIYSLGSSSSTDEVQLGADNKNESTVLPAIVSDSSEVELSIGTQKVTSTLQAGEGWDDFRVETLGEIGMEKTDEMEVTLKSTKTLGALVMYLRSVSLVPVKN